MSIYIKNKEVTDIYVKNKPVNTIYLNDKIIYSSWTRGLQFYCYYSNLSGWLAEVIGIDSKVAWDIKKIKIPNKVYYDKNNVFCTVGFIDQDKSNFYLCSELKEFIVDPKNEYLKTIEGVLYSDGKYLVQYPANKDGTDLTLDKDTIEIYKRAVSRSNNLQKVIFNDKLKNVSSFAFEGCENLQKVEINSQCKSLGQQCFANCKNLETIVFGGTKQEWYNVTKGENLFNGIKTTTKKIACSDGNSILNPQAGIYIGDNHTSWEQLINDKEIKVENNTLKEVNDSLECDIFYVDQKITSIGDWAFHSCVSTNIVIPNSVTSIGNYAFNSCMSLESIEIPNRVTSIGGHAFGGCTALESVMIPNSVTSIGNEAFKNCNALTSVTILPITSGEIKLGSNIFNASQNIKTLILPTGQHSEATGEVCQIAGKIINMISNPNNDLVLKINSGWNSGSAGIQGEIPTYAFYKITKIKEVEIIYEAPSINYSAFEGCTSLTSVTIPNSVISIGESAFRSCALTEINLPVSLMNIGKNAFYSCDSLTSIEIPNSVTSIGDGAFYDCDSLESVTIGDGVTSINRAVFGDCDSLQSVTIGKSVTSIKEQAFEGCSSLTSITCYATNPPDLKENAFAGVSDSCEIYVPKNCVELYEGSSWADYFTNFKEITQ